MFCAAAMDVSLRSVAVCIIDQVRLERSARTRLAVFVAHLDEKVWDIAARKPLFCYLSRGNGGCVFGSFQAV